MIRVPNNDTVYFSFTHKDGSCTTAGSFRQCDGKINIVKSINAIDRSIPNFFSLYNDD